MKRRSLIGLCALFLGSFSGFAQVGNYYQSANGLTGDTLKSVLHSIIDNHTEFPYSSSGTDVWDILKETDRDTANPSNVILFYSGWSVNANQEYNGGSGWNREHVWAKSRGDFGTAKGAGTDVHHLRPCDISVNSARNNRWFSMGEYEYIDGSGATGCKTSATDWVWEPRDEVKGDVARMIFYMAVRYEGNGDEPDLELVNYLHEDKYTNEPIHGILDVLMAWHLADSVDNFERNRNEVVYSYQGNRNPFIDHPEWACDIWPEACLETGQNVAPQAPVNVQSTNITHQHATVLWDKPTDGILVEEYLIYLDNQLFTSVTDTSVEIPFLSPETTYLVEVEAKSFFNLQSSKTAHNFTTLSLSATIDDLEKQGLVVYPNPIDDVVYLDGFNGAKYHMSDMNGVLVQEGNVTDEGIYCATIEPGNYFLRVDYQGRIFSHKLSKK